MQTGCIKGNAADDVRESDAASWTLNNNIILEQQTTSAVSCQATVRLGGPWSSSPVTDTALRRRRMLTERCYSYWMLTPRRWCARLWQMTQFVEFVYIV